MSQLLLIHFRFNFQIFKLIYFKINMRGVIPRKFKINTK